MTFLKKHCLLITIVAIGFLIRLLILLQYGDFWDDEMFSFIYSQKAWPQGLTYWLWETNPPLHMLILKLWFFVFPANEFWARLPSVILGTATILPVYLLAKLIWNKNTALVSAIFLALHSYNIFWSATARVYSLLMFLSSLSIYFFYKIFFTNTGKTKDKIFFAAINCLLLLSHLSAIFLILSQGIILTIINRDKILSWFKINILPFIISAAWLIPSFLIKSHNQLEKSWFLNLKYDLSSATDPIVNTVIGIQHNISWRISVTLLVLIPIFIISIREIKQKKIPYLILLAFALTPILFSLAFGVWHVKMLIYSLPFWMLVISYSLSKINFTKTLSAGLLAGVYLFGITNLWGVLPLTSWSGVENHIKNQSETNQNQVLIYNNFILRAQIERYLNINIPAIPFDMAQERGMDWDDLVVKKNYLYLNFSDEAISQWFVKKNLAQFNKIILLQGEQEYLTDLKKIIETNNYRQTEEKTKATISGNYYLYTYAKN